MHDTLNQRPQIKRERQTQTMVTEVPWETVRLTALSRDRKLFTTLIEEARDLAMQDQVGKLVVYTSWGTDWRQFGKPKPRRLLQSVVLEEGVAERIQSDILKFLGRREWYAERGMVIFSTSHSVIPVNKSGRDTLPTRIFIAWTTGIWEIFLYPSSGRFSWISYLPAQHVRERLGRRQAPAPIIHQSSRAKYCAHRRR
jgi:hypothetical protein